MKYTLSDFANLAEVVGGVAIVVSLLYVGIQVQDSTRAVRSATANDISSGMSSWYEAIGTDQQSTHVFYRGLTDPEALSAEDQAQMVYLTHGLMLQFQAAYYLAEEGTLDIELRDSITSNLAGVRELPGFQMYWAQRREIFKPSFRNFVDEVMANAVTDRGFERLYRPDPK